MSTNNTQAGNDGGDYGRSMVFVCPGCHAPFPSPGLLMNHLNHTGTDCTSVLDDPANQIPVPPAFLRGFQDGNVSGEYHPTSGYLFGQGETLLGSLKAHEHERRRENVVYYPFADEGEWELAKFLAMNLTKSQMAQFLKLKWFDTRARPSFKTVDQLLAYIANLPHGAQWQATAMEFTGYKTTRPIRLIWRNALEVVTELLSNPMFERYMTYDPHIVMRNMEREYSEFFTGTRAFDIQNQLPLGATIVPIILASDKTPVTRHTGGLEMHPVFLTIGNIQSDVRMQATSHAWRCVAFMPLPEFEIHPDFQTILVSRLFHRCMDVVFDTLKTSALHGVALTDAAGYTRNCYTPLVAYIADLPEQQLVACVSKNASPVTLAVLSQFGDPDICAPRTREHTLQQIAEVCHQVDPWDIVRFQKAAKSVKLLGVHHPFWRDWKFAEPSLFLTGEILHTCHKFFFDHVLKWCKEVTGKEVLDTRFKLQHKRIGIRHFTSGVSHVKQMTGREHRDIERSIVPMLDGVASDQFIYAIRAIVDFIYQAQNPVHTDSSVTSMSAALSEFHATKHAILDAEARRGSKGALDNFKIPKLELMQSFARQTKATGTLIQYTADVSERLLITHCKTTFQRTSHQARDFVDQAVEILNREETIRLFDLYIILRLSEDTALDSAVIIENEEVTVIDPALSFMHHVLPEKESTFRGPRPFRNHFRNPGGILSAGGAIAFHVNVRPDYMSLSIAELRDLYHLPDLPEAMSAYIYSASGGNPTSEWGVHGNVSAWNKFRIQLHSSFRTRFVTRSQVVQAFPPSNFHPLGLCDAVLLRRQDGDETYDVAQVRAVFIPKSKRDLPSYLEAAPLLYVRFFRVVELPAQHLSVGLHRVQRMDSREERASGIIPVTEVVHAVELVPVFSTVRPDVAASSETCMEAYDQYFLNTFSDKETYHVLHET
ncbi:hypothetical protein PAXINDRAFT_20331 [Paxillus involutus ATCC 200175]|uniref:DUF6830 domain-containing protein n=1 Tax=Paxillus involutus ATCC 200175 TaxID=664439 RepID=A0A0C9SMN4_PAXIN|nr:hypothetical protein PAXINDRAFT_20331 [Paxillus involutus ATCC 200175]